MKGGLVVTEQEIQDTQDVLETTDVCQLHQLQQQLQRANETIAHLLQHQQPTSQLLSELFIITL